jgi:hypothetical protein
MPVSRSRPVLVWTGLLVTGLTLLWVLAFLWLGPSVLVVAVLSLLFPPVRSGLRSVLSWRTLVVVLVGVAAIAGVVLLVPDGWLPIPSGPGVLVTPSYVGEPSSARPVRAGRVPQHPFLAGNGDSSVHDDGWATNSYAGPGPVGDRVQVRTAWYGIEECASLAFDAHQRLVALCGDRKGPELQLIDPDTLHKESTVRLPDGSPSGTPAWQNLCARAYFYLDEKDRAVVATTDRRVLVFDTTGGKLRQRRAYDLTGAVPRQDCVVALMPDWSGRIWFGTQDGLVGVMDPASGRVQVHRLGQGSAGEQIANSFAVDASGGVYVVSDHALYRFSATRSGRPRVAWRTAYDRGGGAKPGQLSRGSGTTPTVLPGGRVAITDNAEPRMHVQVYGTRGGRRTCNVPVFAKGHSATENSLVSTGDALFVENNYGYSGPRSVLLGRTTEPGVARVDVRPGRCRVRWTSDVVAPTSVPKASLANGLLYVYSKQHSRWGVDAWYFTAIDQRTGDRVFSRRTGVGPLFNNHYAAIALAHDGSAYVATLGGMVRVRDTPTKGTGTGH